MDPREYYPSFWDKWTRHSATGDDPTDLLSSASDENLVALLSSRSLWKSPSDREAVATQILQRLSKRHSDLPSGASGVLAAARNAYDAAVKGQRPINAAQAILDAGGKTALGETVAAAASSSLTATELSFRVARDHAADVQATQAQSRVSETLAQDAADTAQHGSDATREAIKALKEMGHPTAAMVAQAATREIQVAADSATLLATKNRSNTEGRTLPQPRTQTDLEAHLAESYDAYLERTSSENQELEDGRTTTR